MHDAHVGGLSTHRAYYLSGLKLLSLHTFCNDTWQIYNTFCNKVIHKLHFVAFLFPILCRMAAKALSEDKNLDPVFLKFGKKVYSYEYIEQLREKNLELKVKGRPIFDLVPQAGFQEKVCQADADLLIIGGKKGGGKSFIALFKAFYYMYNSDVSMYAFRKTEDDILRGPWKASKYVFKGFATPRRSSFEWNFCDGKGASFKMEHLQDLGKISDRFRGAEMAYMDIEELPEHTRDNVDIIFDCLSVNRNTVGAKSQVVATCNPVGRSNKLRQFLDWYIDPETDTVIPDRDGCKRYMFNYGSDLSEIAWGNSWEEVYEHPKAKAKIDILLDGKDDLKPEDLILTVQFIEGDYANNKILQVSDKRYVSRLASKGGASVVNDMRGVWRDIDTGTALLSMNDMYAFFGNTEKRDGIMRASADVALTGDYLVIYAFDGHHICDVEAYHGMMSDDVIPFIEKFLQKNGVRKQNFTYDSNGLGVWLKESAAFKDKAVPFNNKSAPSDSRLWNYLKSEAAEKFVAAIKAGEMSISEEVLKRKFKDEKDKYFTLEDRLMEERNALKRKDDLQRFEIISKQQMKLEVGHSPDFIEGMMMIMPLFEKKKGFVRKGFENW